MDKVMNKYGVLPSTVLLEVIEIIQKEENMGLKPSMASMSVMVRDRMIRKPPTVVIDHAIDNIFEADFGHLFKMCGFQYSEASRWYKQLFANYHRNGSEFKSQLHGIAISMKEEGF